MLVKGSENVTIHVEPVTVTLTVLGKTHTITSDSKGVFTYDYRGERLGYAPEKIKERILELDILAAEKAERSKRLKKAATEPEPAMFWVERVAATKRHQVRAQRYSSEMKWVEATPAIPAHVERIGVRGIDQRSGQFLVVRANGDKESVRADRVLRVLAGVEEKELTDAAAKSADLNSKCDGFGIKASELTLSEVEVKAEWDEYASAWVCEFEGERLTSKPNSYRPDEDLAEQINARLVAKTHPWMLTGHSGGEKTPLLVAEREGFRLYTDVYVTKEEAEAAYAAVQRAEKAEKKVKALLEKFAFDKDDLGALA